MKAGTDHAWAPANWLVLAAGLLALAAAGAGWVLPEIGRLRSIRREIRKREEAQAAQEVLGPLYGMLRQLRQNGGAVPTPPAEDRPLTRDAIGDVPHRLKELASRHGLELDAEPVLRFRTEAETSSALLEVAATFAGTTWERYPELLAALAASPGFEHWNRLALYIRGQACVAEAVIDMRVEAGTFAPDEP